MVEITWPDEIAWLFDVLKEGRYRQNDLARALGLEASTIGRWVDSPPKSPNEKSRLAIANALDPDSLGGWEAALERMESTVEELRRAADLREELIRRRRERFSRPSDDPLEALRLARSLGEAAKRGGGA